MDGKTRTRAAIAAHIHNAAERALDDPAKLARAARIVRLALERGRLAPADLLPVTPARAVVERRARGIDRRAA